MYISNISSENHKWHCMLQHGICMCVWQYHMQLLWWQYCHHCDYPMQATLFILFEAGTLKPLEATVQGSTWATIGISAVSRCLCKCSNVQLWWHTKYKKPLGNMQAHCKTLAAAADPMAYYLTLLDTAPAWPWSIQRVLIKVTLLMPKDL